MSEARNFVDRVCEKMMEVENIYHEADKALGPHANKDLREAVSKRMSAVDLAHEAEEIIASYDAKEGA